MYTKRVSFDDLGRLFTCHTLEPNTIVIPGTNKVSDIANILQNVLPAEQINVDTHSGRRTAFVKYLLNHHKPDKKLGGVGKDRAEKASNIMGVGDFHKLFRGKEEMVEWLGKLLPPWVRCTIIGNEKFVGTFHSVENVRKSPFLDKVEKKNLIVMLCDFEDDRISKQINSLQTLHSNQKLGYLSEPYAENNEVYGYIFIQCQIFS